MADLRHTVACAPTCGRETAEEWRITNRSVSFNHGCCQNQRDVLDVRRITDVSFRRKWWQIFCCRGSLVRAQTERARATSHRRRPLPNRRRPARSDLVDCGWGTGGSRTQIIIADDPSNPKTEITTFGMLGVYEDLKAAWLQAKQSTAVDV